MPKAIRWAALGLCAAALGGLALWKLGSERAAESSAQLVQARAERKVASKERAVEELRREAAWAAGARRLRNREYGPLVKDARSNPQAGTLGLAYAALSECSLVSHSGYVERA